MTAHCRIGILLAAMPLLLSACGTLDFSARAPVIKEPSRERAVDSSDTPSPKSIRQELHSLLEAGEYLSALTLLRREIDKGGEERSFTEEYVRALNGLLETAEEQRTRGDFAEAGTLLQTARQGFPGMQEVAARVKLSPVEIGARIDESAERLMERGLIAYRAGDLEGAIRTWRMIQTFHPGHQASRRAIDTAEVQRRNLEKVSPR